MKAAAIVALSFLFAGVGATAASATYNSDMNHGWYWELQYSDSDFVGSCHKFSPGEDNSYGEVGEDGKHVVLYANQALLVVKGATGNNVTEKPGAGTSYVSPDTSSGNVSDVSHWIVCEYKTPPVDTKVTPAALTVNDLCGVDSDTITGVPGDNRYSGPTVNGNMQSVTFTPGDGEELGSPLPSGWTAGEGGVATFSHTFSNESCVSETQFVTVVWNMNPLGDPPVFDPAQTMVGYKVTSSPDLLAFEDLLVGKCVGFQVDVYRYTTEGEKAAVDHLIDVKILTGAGTPPEPLIEGGLGTAWKFYQNSECAPAPKLIVPAAVIDDPCGPDNASFVGVEDKNIIWSEVEGWLVAQAAEGYTFGDNQFEWDQSTAVDSGEICIVPVEVQPTVTTTDLCGTDNATLAGDVQDGVVWSEVTKADDGTLSITASPAKGRSFPEGFQTEFTYKDSGELCPIEITDVSVTVVDDPPICGPNNDTVNIPEVEGVTFDDTGWVGNERTITAIPDEGYVLDGQSEWTFYDEATACPVTTVAPTVVAICRPDNDTVTIPEVDGVIYTDSGWVGNERTITAAAAEGYALTEGSATSWTFTDVPVAACPDEIGFSYTPTGELAYTGVSTNTNGLAALAIFLMASGTALVGLKVRAQR